MNIHMSNNTIPYTSIEPIPCMHITTHQFYDNSYLACGRTHALDISCTYQIIFTDYFNDSYCIDTES